MAEVSQKTLHAEADAGAAHHAIELSLTAAQGHAGLGGRSALRSAPAHEHAPATGAFSCPRASCPIRVSVTINGIDDLPIE